MEKGIKERWCLVDLAVKVAVVCCCIPLAGLFLSALCVTAYHASPWTVGQEMIRSSIGIGLLCLVISIFLLGIAMRYLFRHSKNPECTLRRFCLCVCVWIFAVGAVWLFQFPYEPHPGSDMGCVWRSARDLANLHVEVLQDQYFQNYPFQVGLVLFFEGIFRILGTTSYRVVGWLNLISLETCVWCGYRIVRRISSRPEPAGIYLLLSATCFPPILMLPLFYGDIPSFAFSWLALFFAMEFVATRRYRYLVGMIPTLFLGTLVRRTTLITAAAIIIVFATQFFLKKEDRWTAKQYLAAAAAILLILLSSFQMNRILDCYLRFRTGNPLGQGYPSTNWLVMGARESNLHCGWYNGWNIYLTESYGSDYAGMDDKCRAELGRIKARFKQDPGYAAWFYGNKLASGWLDPSYQSLLCFQIYNMEEETGVIGTPLAKSVYDGGLRKGLLAFMDQYQNLILCGALFGTAALWKKRGTQISAVLPSVVFLGGFLFYIFWEIKSRYCISFYMILLPIAAAGVWQIYGWGCHMAAKIRSREKKVCNACTINMDNANNKG